MSILSYKNIDVCYSDVGKGSAIVLLHGFLENSSLWDAFIPDLSKKYRIITIDLLGHGATGCLGYIHTMEDQADLVYEVLHQLRIRKAIIAGHSMGGYVALAFAEIYASQVRGLALLNSTAIADSEERKANRERAIKAVKQDHVSFVRLSIANLFSEGNREKFAPEIESFKNEALKTSVRGIIASLQGMKVRKDREVLLHFATYPILLVLGRQDSVLSYAEHAGQAENKKVQLVTFDGGHMSPVENRSQLLAHLSDFFRSI